MTKARNIQDASVEWRSQAPTDYSTERKKWAHYQDKYNRYVNELNEVMLNGMRFEEMMLHYLRFSIDIEQLPVSDLMFNRLQNNAEEFHFLLEYFSLKHDHSWCDFISFCQRNRWPVDICSDEQSFIDFRYGKLSSIRHEIQVLIKQEMILQELIPLQEDHDAYMIEGAFKRNVKRLFSKNRRRHHHFYSQLLRWNAAAAEILDFKIELSSISNRLNEKRMDFEAIASFDLSRESIKSCTADFNSLAKANYLEVIDEIKGFLQTNQSALCFEKSVLKELIERKRKQVQSAFAWEEMKGLLEWMGEQRETGKKRVMQYYQRNVQREVKRADNSYGMRRLYNLRGGRGQERNSLRQIIQTDPELFLSLFPVTLCTPEVASILFKGARHLFDLVIYDEASQMRVEDAFTGLQKGRTIVIAGDKHQMPPSNWFEADSDDRLNVEQWDSVNEMLEGQAMQAESILDFAIQSHHFVDTYLTYHYRSEHADLIAFSNAAFYGNLKPMALNHNQNPFAFYPINGTYRSQMNEQEAIAVVQWLLAIDPDEKGDYPSIGVATLNLKQRDLIIKLLVRERRLSDAANYKVERLEDAGLFIRNLENIQGDERDIIVLSTTFGMNEEGNFARHFGKLGTRAGYRLLNVLVTRARTNIHVFSSFPETVLQEYSTMLNEKRGNWGSGLIFAYIEMVRRKASGQSVDTILNLLSGFREDEGEDKLVDIPQDRKALISLMLQHAATDSDFYIGAPLAGIWVDAHNHTSSYHLHLGVGMGIQNNLVQAFHRLSYLESRGFETLELGLLPIQVESHLLNKSK